MNLKKIMFFTFSIEYPATFSPLICTIWSPNLRPANAAGDSFTIKHTNIPLLTFLTRTPTLPSLSLQRVSYKKIHCKKVDIKILYIKITH